VTVAPPIAQTDADFAFKGVSAVEDEPAAQSAQTVQAAVAHAADPLGPLAQLPGTWKGTGLNTIWRPHSLAGSGQDRFLELNLTNDEISFSAINGAIPNRGLLMHDIKMFGITYMQQISEQGSGDGLHLEPGIWAHVPATSNPQEPQTVVRMASIPHGTAILAQGTTQFLNGGPPHVPDNNILPFGIGTPAPANSDFNQIEQTFTELNLSTPTQFRHASPGVTQAMVRNPNSVLQQALQGQTIKSRTFIEITTKHTPIKGGGTANTAFLAGVGPAGGNAAAVEVDATFWIETVAGGPGHPDFLQLQYTQLVQLDFNGLRWPHVTVGTLRKQ
jgi:hypothetical protein